MSCLEEEETCQGQSDWEITEPALETTHLFRLQLVSVSSNHGGLLGTYAALYMCQSQSVTENSAHRNPKPTIKSMMVS